MDKPYKKETFPVFGRFIIPPVSDLPGGSAQLSA
jgi:hypothetical protein